MPAIAFEPRARLGLRCMHVRCVCLTLSFIYYFLLVTHCRKHFTGVMGTRVLNCIIVIFFLLHSLEYELPKTFFALVLLLECKALSPARS